MSYTSDTLQCILNIIQTQINVLVIQCQTHLGKIFKCTIFVGYGGVINFEWCRTLIGFQASEKTRSKKYDIADLATLFTG